MRDSRHTTIRRSRRGLAMVLVLVALGAGTIIGAAYLASHDNSAAVGGNVSSATEARWASVSGIELGVAVLQTETDWRTAHVNGKVLDDYAIGDALLDLDVMDLETGAPPTEETDQVLLTATALVDGVEQVSTATASISGGSMNPVALDLAEFALFADDRIAVRDRGTITRWDGTETMPVALATRNTAAGTVRVDADAVTIDGRIYAAPGSSASLVSNAGETVPTIVDLPSTLPFPLAPAMPSKHRGFSSFTITVPDFDLDSLAASKPVTIAVASAVTVHLDADLVLDGNLAIMTGCVMRVSGDVVLTVHGQMIVGPGAAIELEPGASLVIHAGDHVTIDESYVGNVRTGDEAGVRDTSGGAPWMDARRIRIYGEAGDARNVTISNDSVVKASLYAPGWDVTLEQASALYGRLAAARIEVRDDAAVFYDPRLDTGQGFTNFDCALYKEDGFLQECVQSLASLDDAAVSAVATGLGTTVEAAGSILGSIVGKVVEVVPLGAPTPRPVSVQAAVRQFGADAEVWEEKTRVRTMKDEGKITTRSDVELASRSAQIATKIRGLDLDFFCGSGHDASAEGRSTHRAALAAAYDNIASSLGAGDLMSAAGYIEKIRMLHDGKASPLADWMVPSAQRAAVDEWSFSLLTETLASAG